jgi:hypothetical protein
MKKIDIHRQSNSRANRQKKEKKPEISVFFSVDPF